jgi:hypothetical protein
MDASRDGCKEDDQRDRPLKYALRRSAKFDLSLSLAERRGADGSPAGIEGALEYASYPVRSFER